MAVGQVAVGQVAVGQMAVGQVTRTRQVTLLSLQQKKKNFFFWFKIRVLGNIFSMREKIVS